MALYGSIENIGKVFELIQVEYNDKIMTVAEACDSVTMLLGELYQFSTFIEKMGGDGQVDTITDLEQTMKAYQAELTQALAQSADKTRVTQKKVAMKQLLDVWYAYERKTAEVQGSKELASVYKSIEIFIAELERLELDQDTTASDLEAVLLGVRRIVADVHNFYILFWGCLHITKVIKGIKRMDQAVANS